MRFVIGESFSSVLLRAALAAATSRLPDRGVHVGGVRGLIHDRAWQLGLGADVTFYSKPAALDSVYGDHPVSFQIFLRVRPGRSNQRHH
jgi:hypothetical protein